MTSGVGNSGNKVVPNIELGSKMERQCKLLLNVSNAEEGYLYVGLFDKELKFTKSDLYLRVHNLFENIANRLFQNPQTVEDVISGILNVFKTKLVKEKLTPNAATISIGQGDTQSVANLMGNINNALHSDITPKVKELARDILDLNPKRPNSEADVSSSESESDVSSAEEAGNENFKPEEQQIGE